MDIVAKAIDAQVTLEQLTRVFIKIREKRTELTAKFKEADGFLIADQDKIKAALLDYCKDHGVTSGNTAGGQFIRSVKTKYWTSDWESMNKFIIENNLPEFYTKSLNQSNVKTFMEENPDVIPPGLNIDSEYVMTVKKPAKRGGSS
jgi:hypothetical protein